MRFQTLPPPSFYLFRAYKNVAKNHKFLHLRKKHCCTTKEVFETKYDSWSPILFLVQKKNFLQIFQYQMQKVSFNFDYIY